MAPILVGCEESQIVTKEIRKLGLIAFSCDLKPCSGSHPEWHIQGDVFNAIQGGLLRLQTGELIHISEWDTGIFYPDCTYLTCSAEWAYKNGPYHQKVKSNTLVGEERKIARENAIEFVKRLWDCGIKKVSIENPVGVLGTRWKK